MAVTNSIVKQQPKGISTFMAGGQEIKLSKEIVKANLVSGDPNAVTDQEINYFMALCKAQGLNPFVKDAYLIKYSSKSPAAVVTSIGAMEKRAADFPEYAGIKSGIVVLTEGGEIVYREGALYMKAHEELIGGWAEVYRSDREIPTRVELSLDEYIQRKNDGTPNSNWAGKPATMIRKCAKAAAYREAFPKQNAGLYEADEVGKDDHPETLIIQTDPEPEIVPMSKRLPDVIESSNPFA